MWPRNRAPKVEVEKKAAEKEQKEWDMVEQRQKEKEDRQDIWHKHTDGLGHDPSRIYGEDKIAQWAWGLIGGNPLGPDIGFW